MYRKGQRPQLPRTLGRYLKTRSRMDSATKKRRKKRREGGQVWKVSFVGSNTREKGKSKKRQGDKGG